MQAFQAWNAGSIPAARTTDCGKFWACAGVGEPGQTVNLLSYDWGGSNPPTPTKIRNTPLRCVFYFDYVEVGGCARAPGTFCATRKRSFVNNWRAWRIRRWTINNHSKTDMFNRVFDYGWFIVCQGSPAPTTLRKCFGWQATKFKPLVRGGVLFVFQYLRWVRELSFSKVLFLAYFRTFLIRLSETALVSVIPALIIAFIALMSVFEFLLVELFK